MCTTSLINYFVLLPIELQSLFFPFTCKIRLDAHSNKSMSCVWYFVSPLVCENLRPHSGLKFRCHCCKGTSQSFQCIDQLLLTSMSPRISGDCLLYNRISINMVPIAQNINNKMFIYHCIICLLKKLWNEILHIIHLSSYIKGLNMTRTTNSLGKAQFLHFKI